MPEAFHIVIKRSATQGDDLIPGKIYLGGDLLGSTYERTGVQVPAGDYAGNMRYTSSHHFVQGSGGSMQGSGDFLLEVSNVPRRTDILLHTGNKPKHSDGCILLGPISSSESADGTTVYSVGDDSPLRKLRLAFYGTDQPISSPDKQVVISIVDPQQNSTASP